MASSEGQYLKSRFDPSHLAAYARLSFIVCCSAGLLCPSLLLAQEKLLPLLHFVRSGITLASQLHTALHEPLTTWYGLADHSLVGHGDTRYWGQLRGTRSSIERATLCNTSPLILLNSSLIFAPGTRNVRWGSPK